MTIISKSKKFVTNNTSQSKNNFKCVCCGKEKKQDKYFYKSNSPILKANNQRMVICRECCIDLYEYLVEKHDDCKTALYFACRMLDVYFDSSLYYSAEQQANNSSSKSIFAIYLQKCNSLPQYSGKTFAESTPLNATENKNIFKSEISLDTTEEDKRNKDDVIRMVGYDPFENENPLDKKYLYNTLVDFLDESTLEDSFKLPAVIEIVKSFNQIDKINRSLSLLTADINSMQNQTGGIKSLIESKDKIYRAVLAMAKDNGISVNHATNKSKGAGTLSGIIKQLQERGFSQADVNLFDIETAKGIQQVAELSNESIFKQLMLDENDYTWMISEQRELIKKQDKKLVDLEEENRLLKIKLNKYGGDN